MDRLRNAGWLILIQPLALGLQILRSLEVNGARSPINRQFLDHQFVFWASSVDSDERVAVLVNLVLFVGAIVVGLTAITRGRGRERVAVVATAQAVVAVTGLLWYQGDAPALVARIVPVQFGRWTSALFLACALMALALTTRGRKPLARR